MNSQRSTIPSFGFRGRRRMMSLRPAGVRARAVESGGLPPALVSAGRLAARGKQVRRGGPQGSRAGAQASARSPVGAVESDGCGGQAVGH